MKILEYTLGLPPYRRGGLPEYSKDLSNELAKTNQVILMYPGSISILQKNKLKFKRKKSKYKFEIVEMQNPLPVSLGLGINLPQHFMKEYDVSSIISFLKKEKFDVIHLHTLMGLPKEFVEVAQRMKIKIIYTTHDFYGLCPKVLAPNAISLLESTACSPDCMICPQGPSTYKLWIMQTHLYKNIKDTLIMRKLRQVGKKSIRPDSPDKSIIKLSRQIALQKLSLLNYYNEIFEKIDLFHFNSTVSQEYVKKFIPRVKGKVLNITLNSIKDERKPLNFPSSCKNNKSLILGYVGPYDKKKGFFEFIKVAKQLRKSNTNYKIVFCGDNVDNEFFNNNWVVNYGVLQKNKMKEFYSKVDLMVMPSLWHETFGFVALEAASKGIPCLVSKNVGSKDLLPASFAFKDDKELLDKLISLTNNPELIWEYHKELNTIQLPLDFRRHCEEVLAGLYK